MAFRNPNDSGEKSAPFKTAFVKALDIFLKSIVDCSEKSENASPAASVIVKSAGFPVNLEVYL